MIINTRSIVLMGLLTISSFGLTACATPMSLTLHEHAGHYNEPFDSSKGYVFIYRERDFIGSARGIYISVNSQRIGGLNNGTYFVYASEPGEVMVCAENLLNEEESCKRQISVESGRRYYIRGSLKSGFWDAVPHIEIVNELEGQQAVKPLTYATME